MEFSLVVPSFKQVDTICNDLRNITATLERIDMPYEILLVVDGDVDHTAQRVQQDPMLSHISIHGLTRNRGKGAALQYGLSKTSGEVIGFIDAGGDIDASCLPLMLDLMKFSGADIVIGSKRHELSKVSYPLIRRVYSTGYQMLNRILFNLDVKDTQVGLKLFRREVIQTILPHITIDRFAFDLELLVIASRLGYTNIIESPVRITHTFKSSINMKVVFETLADTLEIYIKTRIKGTHVSEKNSAHEYEMG